jgi:F-type H+-transporting ATPase subunit delta
LAAKTLQAKRYARAIFEIASEKNELDRWAADLRQLAALSQNAELASVMENPKYAVEAKGRLLQSQAGGASPEALNLAALLTAHGIFGLLGDVFAEYTLLLDQLRGVEKAEVITAVPLEENQKAKLVMQLQALSGKKIELTLKVEPAILGGLVARVGGKLIDGSTSSQLANLKNELANTGR